MVRPTEGNSGVSLEAALDTGLDQRRHERRTSEQGRASLVALALRPQAMQAAQPVGTQQVERRVLRLTNPELPGASASNTLVANIQIVMPGEIARAHRHSGAALRLIIDARCLSNGR